MTRLRFRFNQYKSNTKLYGEGRCGSKQEKLIKNFFLYSDSVIHEDVKVQIIDHFDPNDQEARENFWIFHPDILHPKGLN